LNGYIPFEVVISSKRKATPYFCFSFFNFLATLPLYPPPLVREGEDIKKRGEAPLKHLFPPCPRLGFVEGGYPDKGIGYNLT